MSNTSQAQKMPAPAKDTKRPMSPVFNEGKNMHNRPKMKRPKVNGNSVAPRKEKSRLERKVYSLKASWLVTCDTGSSEFVAGSSLWHCR